MKHIKMIQKNIVRFSLILFLFFTITGNAQTDSRQYFIQAKAEIEAMLNGKQPLDYERAVFITENPYYDNQITYQDFQEVLNENQFYIGRLIKQVNQTSKPNPKKNFLVSADSAKTNCDRLVANYSIFKYITDTIIFKVDSFLLIHYPYTYSHKDPLATDNWENSQVLHLLSSQDRSGNCNALTSIFKIYSLRLNSYANLCTTQGHIFLSHADENGIYYNVELASKAFPGTGSIETLTHTTDEAARNGIAMRELNLKQSVGLCLINLAKGYQYKMNIKADNFMLQCAELALKHDSLNLNAMLLKAEVLEEMVLSKHKPFEQIKTTKDFSVYQNYIKKLYNLGYREMPADMKNILIAGIAKDTNYKALLVDHTYYPHAHIDKNYKRSASLSNGLFEEVDIFKPQEKYFRTVFDTKKKKIIAFTQNDTLYNKYDFDPVVFALSVDPKFRKGPDFSPYAAFGNNPLLYIDDKGEWPTPVHHDILKKAFGNYVTEGKMTSAQLEQLILGSDNADSPFNGHVKGAGLLGNQSDARQFVHGMRPKNMTEAQAIKAADDWINGNVDEFVKTGDFEKLGEAMHTVMDITSPAHRDENGSPLVYKDAIDHHYKEDPNAIEKNNGKNGYITVTDMTNRRKIAADNVLNLYNAAIEKRTQYLEQQKAEAAIEHKEEGIGTLKTSVKINEPL